MRRSRSSCELHRKRFARSNYAAIAYRTQGASHIYAFEAKWFVVGSGQAPVETQMEIASPRSHEEGKEVLSKKGETGSGEARVCINAQQTGLVVPNRKVRRL